MGLFIQDPEITWRNAMVTETVTEALYSGLQVHPGATESTAGVCCHAKKLLARLNLQYFMSLGLSHV